MSKPKKKFKDTVVGGGLIGVASLINPALGQVLNGALNVGDAIKMIGESDTTVDEKLMLQEFALKQYEAEVQDRASARQREAAVALSGGNDYLFKSIGIVISLMFIVLVLSAVGVINLPLDVDRDFLMLTTGAVFAKMTSIVDYFYGSSMGSKQKTHQLNQQ